MYDNSRPTKKEMRDLLKIYLDVLKYIEDHREEEIYWDLRNALECQKVAVFIQQIKDACVQPNNHTIKKLGVIQKRLKEILVAKGITLSNYHEPPKTQYLEFVAGASLSNEEKTSIVIFSLFYLELGLITLSS